MDSTTLVYFDSRNQAYKKPFGAVKSGERVAFALSVSRRMAPITVELLYKEDGEADYHPVPAAWSLTEGARDLYTVSLCIPTPGLYEYAFRITTQVSLAYYASRADGHGGEGVLTYDSFLPYYLTVYEKDFETPDWFSDGVTYQIFPDRFARKGKIPQIEGRRILPPGAKPHRVVLPDGAIPNDYFYGGNLQGIIGKLGYLSSLGVTTLYINPIFSARSNHRYDTSDYLTVDPMLGDEEDLKKLCREAEKRGMRILLDGVFNHTGDDSIYFNKYGNYPDPGAWQGESSPYYDWFVFRDFPEDYECWWDVKILPAVNQNAPSFRKFIYGGEESVARRWLRCGASGWRLDVADELPDDFIGELREAVKSEKPEALVLGEVWEDASIKIAYDTRRKYLLGHELDGVMNYPFRDGVLLYLLKEDAEAFREIMECVEENYPYPVRRALMNLIGTHDTPRILSVLAGADEKAPKEEKGRSAFRLSEDDYIVGKERLMLASLLLFTALGSPTIYYGDEGGMEGLEDPYNRAYFSEKSLDKELTEWYRKLSFIRRAEKVFSRVSPDFLEAKGARLALSWDDHWLLLVNAGEKDESFFLREDYIDLLTGGECRKGRISLGKREAKLLKKKEELA